MAYAFLKALGIKGNIGTITIDYGRNSSAMGGHRVLSYKDGRVEIESTRYPFCFFGDGKSPTSTRSILPFVPFNQELNRLMLVVKNLHSGSAKITWGNQSRHFSSDQLERGINLAAEFLDNPFCGSFKKLERKILVKQRFEKFTLRDTLRKLKNLERNLELDKELDSALNTLRRKLFKTHRQLLDDVHASVAPVKHVLMIQPQ
jgi:hypothetical protein